MLRLVAETCTKILINHNTISRDQWNIYIYGFELFYSTTFCIISILMLGVLLGYFSMAAAFVLFFVPIRVPAGGYHAKSYGRCFFLTNTVAIGCVVVSKVLWQIKNYEVVLWGLLAAAFVYIWMNSPVQTKEHPLKPERILKNRKYARYLLVVEAIILLLLRGVYDGCVVYTGIVTSYAVAIMILLAKKGG